MIKLHLTEKEAAEIQTEWSGPKNVKTVAGTRRAKRNKTTR